MELFGGSPFQNGVAPRWIHLLMTCVHTITYSIIINGHPHGHIVPTRGVRQGDPLSPYFFILCAEALSSLLHHVGRKGGITGVPITRGGISINHLLFADDSLLFFRANLREWGRIQELLAIYEKASGQKLNREKTSLFFSRNTYLVDQTHIINAVEIPSSQQYEKYIGLPALIGRSKLSAFNGIKGRIWNKMNEWKEKFLSRTIVPDPLCSLCGQEVELSAHIIWQCPASTEVWAECN